MNKFVDSIKSMGSSMAGFISGKSYSGLISGNLPTSRTWGASDFLKANEISLYTNRAIAKRAEKVGEIEFVIKDNKGEVIEQHPLVDLLKQPNKRYTGVQFWTLYQKYMDILGSAFIVMEGQEAFERAFGEDKKINQLHLLRPDQVQPKFDDKGMVTHFEHRSGGVVTNYTVDQVIYIFNPDPKRPLVGQSLMAAGVTAIQTEVQIGAYHSRVLENGGKVEGVFQFKTPRLTASQMADLKAGYKKDYADARKSGSPLFLGGDANYVKTGLTPDELSYLEAKKTTLNDICIMTGVPKPLLSTFDDIQYSNADAAIRIFLRETVVPLLKGLADGLDKKIGDGVTISFIDPTPENVEEELKKTESGIKNYYMTINEARQRHGLDEVADGDKIMMPFNLTELGTTPEPKKESAKKKDNSIDHPFKDEAVRRVYEKIVIKRADVREAVFKKVLANYFTDQRDRMIEMLQPAKTYKFRKKELLDDVLRVGVEVQIGKDAFLPTMTQMLIDAGAEAYALAETAYEFNLTSEMTSWLDKRSGIFLNQINDTTYNTLKDQFAQSLDLSESRNQLIKRIENTYGDIAKHRAKTIARTEVHGVTQFATMEGYKQAGLTIKIWVTVGDSRVRHSHAIVDGEERPMDMAFSNGLMMPSDPNGSAENVINCRCSI
jgi:HK97 family phage portal protein